MHAVAILPVKRFDRAKQRLSEALGPETRAALAEAMLRDVLLALARVTGLQRTIVVTGEPRAAALAGFFGAEVAADDRDAGQSAAAGLGLARARSLGAGRALLVPGDCPALDPEEVTALLARHMAAPAVAIVPDRHGTGTNAAPSQFPTWTSRSLPQMGPVRVRPVPAPKKASKMSPRPAPNPVNGSPAVPLPRTPSGPNMS